MEVSIIEGNARIQTKGPQIGSSSRGRPVHFQLDAIYVDGAGKYKRVKLNKLKQLTSSDSLAEWSKAPDLGSGPKGRGFKSHSCQFSINPLLLPYFGPFTHSEVFFYFSSCLSRCIRKIFLLDPSTT